MRVADVPFTLEVNPRSLLGLKSVASPAFSSAAVSAQSAPDLDAIFVPTRGRPDNVRELLVSLPLTGTPVFLMPTFPTDIPSTSVNDSERVHVLPVMGDQLFVQALPLFTPRPRVGFAVGSHNWDLPIKRNYALWFARRRGFRNILILDDDIRGLGFSQLAAGARALRDNSVAGFYIDDFPDLSVVGHARRLIGRSCPTFLSGGCLFLRLGTGPGFFPPIYNDDWLFLISYLIDGAACALGELGQKPHDPFAGPFAARFQEFGETIADGLYALLVSGLYHVRLERRQWKTILSLRRTQLADIIDGLQGKHRGVLQKALQQSRSITEADCVRFLQEWDNAAQRWNDLLSRWVVMR